MDDVEALPFEPLNLNDNDDSFDLDAELGSDEDIEPSGNGKGQGAEAKGAGEKAPVRRVEQKGHGRRVTEDLDDEMERAGRKKGKDREDDLEFMLRGKGGKGGGARAREEEEEVVQLHRAVQSLLDDEESLLNLHMNVIQENADLLTEEGRLLQQIQGEDVVDYDIDAYAARLEQILDRKMDLIATLRGQLGAFRARLQEEESAAKRVSSMPQY